MNRRDFLKLSIKAAILGAVGPAAAKAAEAVPSKPVEIKPTAVYHDVGRMVYVNSDPQRIKFAVAQDGKSWDTAYPSLKDAMDDLEPGKVIHIASDHYEEFL